MAEPIDLGQRRLRKSPPPTPGQAQNKMILDRIKGTAAQPASPETDADPQNPNKGQSAVHAKNDCLQCVLVIHGSLGNYCGSAAWENYTTGKPLRTFPKTPRWCPGMVTEAEQEAFVAGLSAVAAE